jgi:cold-inducible RNA-binding protein
MNIYVGNLPFSMRDSELEEMFSSYGQVSSASVIMDRETNRSRGFGFVEMPNSEEAQEAIRSLSGAEQNGRKLVVNEARPRDNNNDNNRRSSFRRDR